MRNRIKHARERLGRFDWFCLGVGAGGIAGLYAALQMKRGMELSNAGLYTHNEGGYQFLHLELMNGEKRDYLWQAAKPE